MNDCVRLSLTDIDVVLMHTARPCRTRHLVDDRVAHFLQPHDVGLHVQGSNNTRASEYT